MSLTDAQREALIERMAANALDHKDAHTDNRRYVEGIAGRMLDALCVDFVVIAKERERELSTVRLDLISALGQAQDHQERANTAYDALREIEAIVRNPMPDDHKLDGIGAIVSNGPLDTAPGGPREDECARLTRERDRYRDALEALKSACDRAIAGGGVSLADMSLVARAALNGERKDQT